MHNLERLVDHVLTERFPHNWMNDFSYLRDFFCVKVPDAVSVIEERRQSTQCNIRIFIDRETNNLTAVLSIPDRVICAPTEQRYS
jgi:hypothetical protein